MTLDIEVSKALQGEVRNSSRSSLFVFGGKSCRNTMWNASQPHWKGSGERRAQGESGRSFCLAWDFAISFIVSRQTQQNTAPSGALNYSNLMFVGLSEVALNVWPARFKEDRRGRRAQN